MKVIEFCRTLRSDEAQCLVGHDADLSKAALAEPPEKRGYGGLGVKGLMFRVLRFLNLRAPSKGCTSVLKEGIVGFRIGALITRTGV